MSTDITFPASVGNVRKGCQSSALQSLTKPSYPALARYRPLRYLRSCSDSALEDWAGSPSAAGASVISTSTIGVAGSSDAWKNRTSETFERCAGMAAGAVSDRMSPYANRIVSRTSSNLVPDAMSVLTNRNEAVQFTRSARN